tara:strand:- start:1008 stop:2573 length:1566 start_codon:yes stop_codon:yes gene_type:complete
MKKFKIQSFLQKGFFKKNILSKLFSKFFTLFNMPKSTWKISFNQFKKKNIENYLSEKFQLNYALFILSIVFFLYLLYLSIPGIVISENIQKELEEKLKREYNLDFALTPDIDYSILPKPHYIVKDVVIFTEKTGYQKEFSQIKRLKIFINQNNFFKMNNIIKKVEIKDANFFIENSDFKFINNFLDNGFSKKSIKILKSKIFYKSNEGQIVTFFTLENILISHDELKKENSLISKGKIFNIPFTFDWKYDENLNEKTTKVRLNPLKLNLLNKSKSGDKVKNLKINFKRSKLNMDYFLEKNSVIIKSNRSFLGTNKFDYNGKINLDPFDFQIESKIQKFDLKKIIPNKNMLDEIFSQEFLLNENFNGRLAIKSDNLNNGSFFNEILINSNYVGEKIELSNSKLFNKKIGSLNLDYGNIYLEENDIFFKGKFSFEIFDKNKFYRKFLVSKKNQKDLEKVYFGLIYNLSKFDAKIFFISLNEDKPEMSDNLDNLIYSFNNNSITVNNWISLRSFINKILSSYPG